MWSDRVDAIVFTSLSVIAVLLIGLLVFLLQGF
jgi:hypothetical protein